MEVSVNEPLGIALFRAVQHLGNDFNRLNPADFFSVPQLIEQVWEDPRSQEKTKEALVNRLEMANGWDIFSQSETDLSEILDGGCLNVLDLSVLSPGAYGLANLIVSVVSRTLFQKRVVAKRRENLCLAPQAERIWLLIDEAQRFVPASKSTLSKDLLIAWAKEGRQPGLSVAFATQQPSAIDNDILSQCDLILCHRPLLGGVGVGEQSRGHRRLKQALTRLLGQRVENVLTADQKSRRGTATG